MSKVLTNWIVITGVTCSGKSTLVRELADFGYKVKEEIARDYLAEMIQKGIQPDDLKKDRKVYFEKLFNLQIEFEKSIINCSSEIIFFDRAIPDILAYGVVDNFDTSLVLKKINYLHRYKKIFVLDPLPFIPDGFRSNSLTRRKKLNLAFESEYKKIGYEVIRITNNTLEERVKIILEMI